MMGERTVMQEALFYNSRCPGGKELKRYHHSFAAPRAVSIRTASCATVRASMIAMLVRSSRGRVRGLGRRDRGVNPTRCSEHEEKSSLRVADCPDS
jgi:hypothetical protein